MIAKLWKYLINWKIHSGEYISLKSDIRQLSLTNETEFVAIQDAISKLSNRIKPEIYQKKNKIVEEKYKKRGIINLKHGNRDN